MDGCGHCGFNGPLEHRGNVTGESHTRIDRDIGEYSWEVIWSLSRCPQCKEPTLATYSWSDEFSDPDATVPTVVYPSPRDDSVLPPLVRKHREAARRVKGIDPSFYALGIRRMLEAMCLSEGAHGRNLNQQLQSLATEGRLPQTLVDVTKQLRQLGNLGAHVGDVEIVESDVPLIDGLAEAMLEYLYRAPAAVAAVEAELARRTDAGTGDDAQ